MNHVEVKRRQIQAFSYILGLITLVLAGRKLEDYGIAYLAAAAESCAFFLLLLGYSVPEALGRLLRSRNARGQFKNAAKIRKMVLLFQCVLGAAGAAVLFLISDVLEKKLWVVPYTSFLIRLMAPVLLLRVVSGVLEGYFQGRGTEMPTAAVSVLRQIFWLGLGLLLSNICMDYGGKVSALLRNDRIASMYGAAGWIAAMILTELFMLLFLFLIHILSRKKENSDAESLKQTERFGSCIGALYGNMGGNILMNLLGRLPVWLGLILLQHGNTDGSRSVVEYGVYYGKYLVLCAFPILFSCAVLLPICARVAANIRREEYRFAKDVFGIGFHVGVVYTLFAAIFTAVMAEPLIKAFFVGDQELAAKMLQAGSSLVIFTVLSIYFVRVLLLTGARLVALCAVGIYSMVSVAGLAVCFKAVKLGPMSLVWAGVAGTGILCVLTGALVFRKLRVKPELVSHLVIPAGASGVSGLVCMFLGKAVIPHLGSLVTLILCFVLGLALYWVILLALRSFRPYELELIPFGGPIKALAKLLRAI